jgi:filamentous hemagglutinin family protein
LPTSELSAARRKSARRSGGRDGVLVLLGCVTSMAALQAAPTGGQITGGSGSVTQTGNTTTVVQTSANLFLNWQSFNVAANQIVDFVQPNSSALAVNRISSSTASQIFGHVDANGQVWFINPNGILFGAGAQVNVGGLVASTLDLDVATLGTDSRRFSGSGTGSIVNRGSLTANDGGYVALLGNRISNQGLISARLGTVALGAGSAETLSFSGKQLINLRVDKSTLDNLTENKQLIEADGGRVIMTAGAADSVLASVVNNSGVIEARGVEDHAGTITLLAGMAAGEVDVGGTLATAPQPQPAATTAVAGSSSGSRSGDIATAGDKNRGSIVTSGATVKFEPDAKIDAGAGGSWVIDPTDLTINAAAASSIENALNTGTSVTEQTTATSASGAGTQTAGLGDINVDAPIAWSNAAATLTLTAYHGITVNAAITGSGAVVMQAASGNLTIATGATITGDAGVTLGTGANFINDAGAAALSAGATGRWLVYSTNSATDTDGGLSPAFIQYAAAYAATPVQTGNGLLYSVAPSVTVTSLSGTVTKTYDGGTTAMLGSGNYTASGLIDGDLLTAMSGSYQSSNVGTGINVTSATSATALKLTNAAGTPVYGYGLSGAPLSAAIGTITPAPLTASIVGDPTKVYDGTTTATLLASNYALSGFVTGQSATVNQPSSVAYASPNAGTQTVSATFANTNFVPGSSTDLGNYTLPNTASGAGTVQPAPLVIQGVLATDKVYNGTTSDALNVSHASLYGIIGSDAVTLSTSGAAGNFASANVGNSSSVTASGFTLAGAQDGNYQLTQPTGLTASITPAPLTITGVSATNKIYDGTQSDVLNTSAAMLSGVIATDSSRVVLSSAAAAGTFATANVGSGLAVSADGFSISGASASNYTLAQPSSFSASITPAPLSVSLIGDPAKSYNGTSTATPNAANFSLSGFVAGQGATIPQVALAEYASANAGTQAVTVTLQASDYAPTGATILSNYTLPTSVTGSGTITPAQLTGGIVGNPTKAYDGTTTGTLTGANYVLSGFVSGQGATITQTTGTYASANAGVEGITATLTPANYVGTGGTLLSNYALPTSVSGTGNITPLALAGQVQAAIINDPTKPYDGTTTATLTSSDYVLSGFVTGQGATVNQTVGQYASANAGVQTLTANLTPSNFTANSGTTLSNYSLPSIAYGTGTITPAMLNVSIVGDPTRVYNGGTNMILSPANYSIAGFVSGQGATINPSALIAYASPNVGAQSLTAMLTPSAYTATGATNLANYVLATSASGAGQITPAPLYVTGVLATNKVYDTTSADALNTAAVALAGAVPSDSGNLSLLGTPTGTFASANVGNAIAVAVSGYALGGAAATNYALQPVAGIAANITPAPLSISGVSAVSKNYDASNAAALNNAAAALSGVLGSDAVSLSTAGSQGTFSSVNVGSSLPVSASGYSISGAAAGNYSVSQPSGLTASILPAPITALITGNPTKVYDGSASTTLTAANYTLTGFANGQGASVPQSATASYVAPDAGTGIGISSTLVLSDFVANSGTNLSNYAMPAGGSGTGTITRAPLVVALGGNPTKSYDGTTGAVLASPNFTLSGFVDGQSASVDQTVGAYASANAGAESVSASLAAANYVAGSGTNLANYSLPTLVSGAGTITRAPLNVVDVGTTSRLYDGTTGDALTGATLSGTFYNGDQPVLTNSTSGTLGNSGNVGTDAVSTNFGVSGPGSANYQIVQPSGLSTVISPVALSATSTVTKTYDGTTVASLSGTNTVLTGWVAGQGATVKPGVDGSFASPDANTGIAITGGALTAANLTANSGTLLANYTLPASDDGTGTINPAKLTYTATPASQVYAGTPATLTGAVSGFVDGQTLATATTGTPSFATPATATSNIGHYAIDGSGLSANNGDYTFVEAAGNATALTITPAPLVVVGVTTTARTYDGTTVDALTGATLTGTLYNGDAPVLTNSGSGVLGNGGNVGTDPVTTSFGLSGPGSGNYAIAQPAGLTALISPQPLTATSAVSKMYDGTTNASLAGANTTLSGFVVGQGASVNGGVTGTFATANVGSGITVTGGALSAADLTASNGTLLTNYTLPSSDNGVGSITPAIVNLAGSRVYDAGLDAAASIFGAGGVVNGVGGQTLVLAGAGTLVGKDVGSGSLASLGSLSLNDGTGLASNYTLAGGTDSVSVTPLAITVTASGANKAYDGNALASATLASSGVLGGDAVNFQDTAANFSDKNAGEGKLVSVSGITIGGANAADYTVNATATTTADITPAIISLAGSRVYDGTVTANARGFGTDGTLAGVGGETVLLTGSGTLAAKNVGPQSLSTLGTLSLGNGTGLASNYTLAGGSDSELVTPLAIAVTATGANKVYDGGTADAAVLASSGVVAGDSVSFADTSATFGNKNAGTGKTVTVLGISASGADAGNYTLTDSATTTSASITPLAITVTATGSNKVYDGTAADTVALAGSGVLSGDVLSFTDTAASFADKNVGTDKTVTVSGITAGGADAGNYSLNTTAITTATITPLAITVSATGSNKVYDGTVADSVALASSGVLAGDTVSFSDAYAGFADKNVGTAKAVTVTGITAGGPDGENYTVNAMATTTADITPAIISLAGSRVYDGTVTANARGFGTDGTLAGVGGETVLLTGSGTLAAKNVGPQSLSTLGTLSLGNGTGLASNYTLAGGSDSELVTPLAIAVTATGANKVYDGGTADAAVLASSGVVAGDSVSFADTSATFGNKNAGTGKTVTVLGISASGADAGNYTLTDSATTTSASITPLAITVTATGSNKVYDGTAADTVALAGSGVLSGDVLSFTDTAASFADKNVGTDKTVTVSGITAGGADAGNYSLNTTAITTATITPLAITVSATGSNKVYDGTVADSVALASSGVLAGDTVSFSDTSATFGNKNAGTAKTVTILGISASGVDAGNYSLTDSATTTTANITPLAITVSTTGSNKVYDGTATDTVTLAGSGVLPGDDLSFTDSAASFADKNVGTAKIVTVTGIAASGVDSENYQVNSSAATTANITPLAITVSATGENKVYDATTADTVVLASRGVLAGDSVSFSDAAATFADKNVGNGKTVTVTGIAASGLDAVDYAVNSSATSTANITPALLTQSATPTVIFTGAKPTLSGTVTGFASGDTLASATEGTLVWTTDAPANSPAGVYAVDGSGLTAQNYVIAQAPRNAAALTVEPGMPPLVTQRVAGQVVGDLLHRDVATPFGVGSDSRYGNNTGNARLDADPTLNNQRLSDFSTRLPLTVVGSGVRLPQGDQ